MSVARPSASSAAGEARIRGWNYPVAIKLSLLDRRDLPGTTVGETRGGPRRTSAAILPDVRHEPSCRILDTAPARAQSICDAKPTAQNERARRRHQSLHQPHL